MARLREKYENTLKKELMKKLKLKNIMQVPKVEKIIVNMGIGEATQNIKALDAAEADLRIITGQKPVVRKAKKSISSFRLRQGMPIGLSVTLRSDRMYEFLDRLISVVFPRIRDFRGISSKSFDGRGNYTVGLKDQLVFPEIDYNKVDKNRGMNITIVTTAKTDDEARELLKMFGMPFRGI
jgi:large subunit ribosomal protein L5